MTDERFVSYAQNYEDVVLARALAPDDHPGFWIDVGAGDPVLDSVTEAFSQRGWTGINVEPCAAEYERLVELRPNEINLRCAVGRRAGFAKLYPGPSGHAGLSTLVPSIAEHHRLDEPSAPQPVEVEVRALAEIADQYAPPVVDFLKVDVEGFEAEVLRGINWQRLRPRVIVIEAIEPVGQLPSHQEWEPLVLGEGYRFVLFDGVNRFYVAAEEDQLATALAAPANVLDDFVHHPSLVQFESAQEYALSLERAVQAEHEQFEEAERYALSLEAVVNAGREGYAAELRELARRYRLMATRAEHADELAASLRDDLAAAQTRGARAIGEAARLAAHVEALEATRTFRSTRRLRSVYGMVRRFGAARP